MNKQRCITCSGSGKVMGGGMMMADCHGCDGKGHNLIPDDDIDYLQMKETDSYKKAIENIKKTSENITDKQAEDLFEKEFKNIDKETKNKKERKNG